MQTSKSAITVSGLTKKYGKIDALRGVNLDVLEGQIVGLVGPNGAGKTTLIKALVGALKPTSGSATILGRDSLKDRWELRKDIGYMPQHVALFESLTATENVTFFGKAQPLHDLEKKVGAILAFTELTDRANDPVHTFSAGMKKRVSLACALIHEPKILFLDEPTAAVDPYLRKRTWSLFRELARQGKTLFISTHLMDEAMLCDKVIIIRDGHILCVDPIKDILKRGQTRLLLRSKEGQSRFDIESEPEAIADKLHEFGLSRDISSIELEIDTLEDIILSFIKEKDSDVP